MDRLMGGRGVVRLVVLAFVSVAGFWRVAICGVESLWDAEGVPRR